MIPIPFRIRNAGFAFAYSLALIASAAAPGSAAQTHGSAKSEVLASEPAVDLPPPPPSPAMEDKFRKLQQEMESAPGSKSASAKASETRPPQAIAVGGLAIKIFFGLAFVLILAVVTIRVLKRLQGGLLSNAGRGGKDGKGGDIFEVLETCHLGAQQRVVALRMNEEVGIVGVTQHGISLLTVLKEPADDLRRSRESNSAAFSDNLNKLLERFKKPKKVSDLLDEAQP
ncbi:MAG: flagellar biosynthetic protein FliO [Fibrobacteria bacterium]